jgi:hypothetical protein
MVKRGNISLDDFDPSTSRVRNDYITKLILKMTTVPDVVQLIIFIHAA